MKQERLIGFKKKKGKSKLRRQPRGRGKLQRLQSTASGSRIQMAVPQTAQRRRRRNNRRLNIPVATIKKVATSSRWASLFLFCVCIAALFYVGNDDAFYLTSIPVEGANSIPAAEIVTASGLGGAHVFTIDPNKAALAVGEVSGVLAATVTLRWPNQAFITVKEETPILVWEQAGEQYWVNEDGSLINARHDIPALLHIISEEPEPLLEGFFIPQDVMVGAQQLKLLRPNIEWLYYTASGGVSYADGRGWRAYFGTGEDMEQKLVVYEQIVADLIARNVQPAYIGVSNQNKPYYQVFGGTP